ncbi:hypothetical protein GQ43DRAFT_444058 [Delitschia confertaspora ATCC 74209]|uniref:Uncharacterized protein n=1 Tax=Delitschia confertaspora ATCC 74209 TaxID=1513339 RepID=A0A9P4JDX7_9PLEO|nr:hypothetical protein GQ43DRAFT_444058 [Delitschia confertaspora ATCC 74209]
MKSVINLAIVALTTLTPLVCAIAIPGSAIDIFVDAQGNVHGCDVWSYIMLPVATDNTEYFPPRLVIDSSARPEADARTLTTPASNVVIVRSVPCRLSLLRRSAQTL